MFSPKYSLFAIVVVTTANVLQIVLASESSDHKLAMPSAVNNQIINQLISKLVNGQPSMAPVVAERRKAVTIGFNRWIKPLTIQVPDMISNLLPSSSNLIKVHEDPKSKLPPNSDKAPHSDTPMLPYDPMHLINNFNNAFDPAAFAKQMANPQGMPSYGYQNNSFGLDGHMPAFFPEHNEQPFEQPNPQSQMVGGKFQTVPLFAQDDAYQGGYRRPASNSGNARPRPYYPPSAGFRPHHDVPDRFTKPINDHHNSNRFVPPIRNEPTQSYSEYMDSYRNKKSYSDRPSMQNEYNDQGNSQSQHYPENQQDDSYSGYSSHSSDSGRYSDSRDVNPYYGGDNGNNPNQQTSHNDHVNENLESSDKVSNFYYKDSVRSKAPYHSRYLNDYDHSNNEQRPTMSSEREPANHSHQDRPNPFRSFYEMDNHNTNHNNNNNKDMQDDDQTERPFFKEFMSPNTNSDNFSSSTKFTMDDHSSPSGDFFRPIQQNKPSVSSNIDENSGPNIDVGHDNHPSEMPKASKLEQSEPANYNSYFTTNFHSSASSLNPVVVKNEPRDRRISEDRSPSSMSMSGSSPSSTMQKAQVQFPANTNVFPDSQFNSGPPRPVTNRIKDFFKNMINPKF